MSDEGPTGTTEENVGTDASGTTEENVGTDASGTTGTISLADVSGSEPPAPLVIRLDDILTDQTLYLQQEARDRDKFAPLLSPSLTDIRAKLVSFAARRFQPPCDLFVIDITAPNICSDGVQRTFFDYIKFVSGKTVDEHVATIQQILPDFVAAYSYTRTQLRVGVVLKG